MINLRTMHALAKESNRDNPNIDNLAELCETYLEEYKESQMSFQVFNKHGTWQATHSQDSLPRLVEKQHGAIGYQFVDRKAWYNIEMFTIEKVNKD